jgi:hypothetical protein
LDERKEAMMATLTLDWSKNPAAENIPGKVYGA